MDQFAKELFIQSQREQAEREYRAKLEAIEHEAEAKAAAYNAAVAIVNEAEIEACKGFERIRQRLAVQYGLKPMEASASQSTEPPPPAAQAIQPPAQSYNLPVES